MRRGYVITVASITLALGVASCGGGSETSAASATAVDVGAPLPEVIKAKGKLRVAVQCNFPPYGYVDAAGKNVGYDIEIAKKLSGFAFGNPESLEYVCATGGDRVAALQSGRVDIIVASLSYTPERAKTVDFSTPYFQTGGSLLVKKGSSIKEFEDLGGGPVAVISGSIENIWLKKCMPRTKQVMFKDNSTAIAAVERGSAKAFSQDTAALVPFVSKNNKYVVTGTPKAITPWGIGIRKGDNETRAWADAALAKMTKDDTFSTLLKSAFAGQEKFAKVFEKDIPRPGKPLNYPAADKVYAC